MTEYFVITRNRNRIWYSGSIVGMTESFTEAKEWEKDEKDKGQDAKVLVEM